MPARPKTHAGPKTQFAYKSIIIIVIIVIIVIIILLLLIIIIHKYFYYSAAFSREPETAATQILPAVPASASRTGSSASRAALVY